MDMMMLGETLAADEGAQFYYGFWMPAGGNDGVGGFEVFHNPVASAFIVSMETKSSDQPDSAAASIGNVLISSTSAANYKFDVANAKDLVRYQVESTDAAGLTPASIHLQFAQPLWHPN